MWPIPISVRNLPIHTSGSTGNWDVCSRRIDRYVGADNALIFISSTGYYDDAVVEEEEVPHSRRRNSPQSGPSRFSIHIFRPSMGSAGYVEAIRDRHVFLDHKAIEARKLDPGGYRARRPHLPLLR